jgi:hypothetical protein
VEAAGGGVGWDVGVLRRERSCGGYECLWLDGGVFCFELDLEAHTELEKIEFYFIFFS